MSDQDARKQSLAELHERRKQVIRLHKRKYGVMQIVELTGLSWPAVRVAIDLYEEGGMAALKPKERGREPGYGRILTPDREAHIRQGVFRWCLANLIALSYGVKRAVKLRSRDSGAPEAQGLRARLTP